MNIVGQNGDNISNVLQVVVNLEIYFFVSEDTSERILS